MRVLVTGFGPFPGVPVNPSAAAVEELQRRADAGEFEFEVVTEVLPVDFAVIAPRLRELIDGVAPDLVICTGVDAGAKEITVERVAINLVDARMPDTSGAQPVDRPVIDGAPDGLFATLPVKAVRAAIDEVGVPAELSLSAGTYGCNAAMFAALASVPSGTRAGFLHIPPTEVIATPRIADALAAAIRAARDTAVDLDEPRGTIA